MCVYVCVCVVNIIGLQLDWIVQKVNGTKIGISPFFSSSKSRTRKDRVERSLLSELVVVGSERESMSRDRGELPNFLLS